MASRWIPEVFLTCPGGVSSAVSPSLLPPGQFAWGMNIAVRGAKPQTRPPIVERMVLPSGLHQCSSYFGVQGGMIVCAIQGQFYRVRVGVNSAGFSCEALPLPWFNSGTLKQVWMQQTIESLVIQDGQSAAVIYNGSVARRAEADEVPRGRQMAYGNGRLWVAINGKELVAGDIRTRTPGSELKFTETNYLSGGGALYFPRGITGLDFIPVTGAADFGTLMVFGQDYAESIRADVTSRDMWAQIPGFVTNVFRDIGCSGDWSIVQVNQDIYWRDFRGDIRSLANSMSTNNTPGSTPISREVSRIVGFDSDQLLPWVSSVYFDNRLLMTASPYLNVSRGVSFKNIVSLDFSPISTMQLKASPAYDGNWCGIPGIAQLVAGDFDGQTRAFAISSGEDGINRLWEIMTRGRDDIILSCGSGAVESPIVSSIEYPVVNFGSQKNRKRLERCDVWFSGIEGELDLTVYWRADNTQKWSQWDAVETCAKITDPPVGNPHVWKNLLPEQRPQIKTFTIPDGVDEVVRYALSVGFEFQIRLKITGKYRLEKTMIFASPIDDPDYANRETLTAECIQNDVTGNEITYGIVPCQEDAACDPIPPDTTCSPEFTFECRSITGEAEMLGCPVFTASVLPPKSFLRIESTGEARFRNYIDDQCQDPISGIGQCIYAKVASYDRVTGVYSYSGSTDCTGGAHDPTPIPCALPPDSCTATWIVSETVGMRQTGGCCFIGAGYQRELFDNLVISLSDEDTETDAINRMILNGTWTDWISDGQCIASREARTTGYTFDVSVAQFRITATGVSPGFVVTAEVPIYRRTIGVGPYTLFQTISYEETANGIGVALFEIETPNAAGFDSYAGAPVVTAQKCED